MRIPLVPADMDGDETLFSGSLDFNEDMPKVSGSKADYMGSVRRAASYCGTVLVIDVVGLRKGTINNILLKKLKNRRNITWFMTHIKDAEDVFDAFNTDADAVLFPYRNVSDYDLSDIVSVSNSAIPVLFVIDGSVFGTGEKLGDAVENVFEIGFPSAAVFDLDGSLDIGGWQSLMCKGRIIPYSVKLHESVFEYLGAKDVFVDFI